MINKKQALVNNEMISQTEVNKLKAKIYRAFAVKTLVIFVVIAGFAQLSINFVHQQKLQNLTANAVTNLFTIDKLVHNNLNFMENQVQQFVSDSELSRYLITRNEISKQFVLNNWQNIAERLQWFSKIELISRSGVENIRVDYDPLLEQAVVSPSDGFQKSLFEQHNAYIALDEKPYVSPIDLNKAFNEPTYPITPIVNISSRITIVRDQTEGIVKASILADKLLEPLTQMRKNHQTKVLMLDKKGYYVQADNIEFQWGQYILSREQYNFSAAYPDAWANILAQRFGVLFLEDNTLIFRTIALGEGDSLEYILIDDISNDYVSTELSQQNTQIIVFTLVLFFVLTIALWSMHANKITRSIQKYTLELTSVLFNSGDAIIITDKDWQISSLNDVFIQLTGYHTDEVLKQQLHSILDQPLSPEKLQIMEQTIKSSGLWRGKLTVKKHNQDKMPCLLTIAAVKDDNKIITHYVVHTIDITEQEALEQQIKLAAVALETKAGILITDQHGLIQRVNSSFSEISGYQANDVLGKNPNILSSGKHQPAFFKEMWYQISQFGHWEGEIWNKRKDGEIYPTWSAITSIKDSDNIVKNYVATFHDITIRKRLEEKLEALASTDPLTGCLNRRSFETRFDEQVSFAKRHNQTFGMVIFDIDFFKQVNDNYGHDAGDAVLVQLALTAKETLRESDIVARWGGEEFVALLPYNNQDETIMAAERLRMAFKSMASMPAITCSFGVVNYHRDDSFDEIIKRADQALYQAKRDGRDRVTLAKEQM